jgi:TonB family protein
VLPTIIQQKYGEAKAAFDRKDYAAAGVGFTHVLQVLGDPDVAPIANQPPLSDLRTLAMGFQDLNAHALAPPDPAPSTPQPQPAQAPTAPPPRVYDVTDTNVVPPVVIHQALPPFRHPVTQARGAVEVVIDENGAVESAMLRQSIGRPYDSVALEGVRKWRYKPATRDGVPVKFRKVVLIAMTPQG